MNVSDINKRFLRFAAPSIVGMLIVSFQIMIDGLFVSKGVGVLGLAAVNISMPLVNVLLSVAVMIVSGGIVICGIAQG
ncbi:MAG: MATE family efflux transporter, partial [Candidatus Limimorpha sp.]